MQASVMEAHKLEEIFAQFNHQKILVVGDVMVDSYIWGSVTRISPEAPVPIVQVQKRESRLGGAANVALNLQALGASPVLCTVIGDDQRGKEFLELCMTRNLTIDGILQSPERITTIKERIMSGSQHIVRIDHETDQVLNNSDRDKLVNTFRTLIDGCHAVVFQDYDKGSLSESSIADMLDIASEKKIPSAVDPKKRNFLSYKGATLFKPNLKELKEGLKIEFDSSDVHAVEVAVSRLKQALKTKIALTTLSEKGIYIDGKQTKKLIPAHLRKIADVSGAGDTVISVASLCLALQMPDEIIAGLSNLAGGIVCESIGVVPVDKQTLLKEAIAKGLAPAS